MQSKCEATSVDQTRAARARSAPPGRGRRSAPRPAAPADLAQRASSLIQSKRTIITVILDQSSAACYARAARAA